MGPRPSLLLVLVLCLGPVIHMEEEVLPKPSIRAEPEPVIRWGQSVTVVCRSPAEADAFRLEDENNPDDFWDQRITSQNGSHGSEARFHIDPVRDVTARRYFCAYSKGYSASEPSDILELTVTAPAFQNYTVGNYVRLGLAAVVLLILVAILAEAGHSWHRWPHRPEEGRQESERRRN